MGTCYAQYTIVIKGLNVLKDIFEQIKSDTVNGISCSVLRISLKYKGENFHCKGKKKILKPYFAFLNFLLKSELFNDRHISTFQ